MNKMLILLRHGEADNAPRDIDRPLTPRGHAMAKFVQRELVAHQVLPQKVLCSPARRTRETCAGITNAMPTQPEIEYVNALYGITPDDAIALIQRQSAECLMVVGHNPWIHMLALMLTAPSELNKHGEMKSMFPPASCAIITFDGMPQKGEGVLQRYFYPAGNFG